MKGLRTREKQLNELDTTMKGHGGPLFMREGLVNNSKRKWKLEQRSEKTREIKKEQNGSQYDMKKE